MKGPLDIDANTRSNLDAPERDRDIDASDDWEDDDNGPRLRRVDPDEREDFDEWRRERRDRGRKPKSKRVHRPRRPEPDDLF